MSVIYIAGPMTGKPDFNRTAFTMTATRLRMLGHTVLNPATLPDGLTYRDYMLIGNAMLYCADTIGEHTVEVWIANHWYSFGHLYRLDGEYVSPSCRHRPRFRTMRRLYAAVKDCAEKEVRSCI